MRHYFAIGFGFTLTALAAGCGSSDTEIGSEGQSGYERYIAEFSELACESGASCCGPGFLLDECRRWLPLMAERPAPEEFVFYPEFVEPCLAGVRANTVCGAEPEACWRVAQGLVAPGESCQTSTECMPFASTLPRGSCGGPEGNMRCQSAAALGEACNGNCDGDLCWSFSDMEGGLCFEEQGTRCGFSSGVCEATTPAGSSCLDFDLCAKGLECNADTCTPLPDAGAPCSSECAEGNYCNAGTCVPKLPPGAACSSPDECLDSCENGTCKVIGNGSFVCLFFGGGL